jgi:hypothetical protein
MRWVNPFMPACDLILETPYAFGPVSDYRRSLDFCTGLGELSYNQGGVAYKREFFVSRADGIAVLRFSSDKPVDYVFSLGKHPMDEPQNEYVHFYEDAAFAEPYVTADKNSVTYTRSYTKRPGQSYTGTVLIAHTDGKSYPVNLGGDWIKYGEFHPRTMVISKAATVTLLFNLFISKKDEPAAPFPSLSFDELFKRHSDIHASRMDSSSLGITGNTVNSKPVDNDTALWLAGKKEASPELLNKIFTAGKYEIFSSSGETPPVLQGIWTGIYGVPWSSTYTNNGNIQTAILSLLPTGLFSAMLSVFNYFDGLMDDFRENARTLFNCRGIHVPSYTSDSGLALLFADSCPMLFWTAGAPWFARYYYDYWLFTLDRDFFINRALPFMKEAAVFYEDFLYEDENGYWLFNPSFSPENIPLNSNSRACVNATMDIAAAADLFFNLITGCRTLGIEEENIAKWRRMLEKMPPYMIDSAGVLKEWTTPLLEDNHTHRHCSHLYMLYYDVPNSFRENKKLMDAARKVCELRFEKRNDGDMGFGLVLLGMVAAHLKDAEMVNSILEQLAKNHYYPTFASSHDGGPAIFNADCSGGVPALMMEALAQSSPVTDKDGRIVSFNITLLPALPDCMASGSVKGLRLRGGYSLDMKWQDRTVIEYTINDPLWKPYTLSKS